MNQFKLNALAGIFDNNNYPAPLLKDVYKVFHKFAYKPGITHVYGNFTNRFGKHSNIPNNAHVMNIGLQSVIIKVLIQAWGEFFNKPKAQAVSEYSEVVNSILGKEIPIDHLEALHGLQYLPISIKSLPEGVLVPYGVPSYTITNTTSGFGWLTNMLETVMSAETWGISTSATTAYAYRKRFEAEPSLQKLGCIKFLGHDFSYRGAWGTEAAAMSGFGHLASFYGSDTIPAALFARKYYGADFNKELVAASVDATEHSVMCSYEDSGEKESLKHLMTNVTPTGILSVVSDTWDFWQLVTEYLPELKDVIMARDGTVVIRPDSGDPVDIICGTASKNVINVYSDKYLPESTTDFETWQLEVAENIDERFREDLDAENPDYGITLNYVFKKQLYSVSYEPDLNRHDKTYYYVDNYGSTLSKCSFVKTPITAQGKGLVECLYEIFAGTDADGLKLLDSHIGAIYGDSITLERQDQIIKRLLAKGFVPNVVLGIGSYSYFYVTRDTNGSAVKATDVQFGEGNHNAISKDPKTDQSKKSARGLLRVDLVDDEYVLRSDVTPEEEAGGELKEIFRNSKLLVVTTLEEIRARIDDTF